MQGSFEPSIRAVLEWEGGHVDNPDDPGGETKFGISQRAYPKVNISKLTKDKARKIYQRDYWKPAGCDEMPSGVDLIVFDGAVNCGVRSSVRFLQESVGSNPDGIWGPKTKAAVERKDPRTVIWEYVARRAIYYTDLSVWNDFGLGWMRRLSEMHQQALKLVKQ